MKWFRLAALAVLGASSLALAQQSGKPAAPAPKPQVLFSGPPRAVATAAASATTPANPVTDALRRSLAITAWDLDVHLTPRDQSLEAHARVTLRNAGDHAAQRNPPPALLHAAL